jgi:hypothetical protein
LPRAVLGARPCNPWIPFPSLASLSRPGMTVECDTGLSARSGRDAAPLSLPTPDMARPRTVSRRGLSSCQSAYKPGFVGRDRSRATTIPLGRRLLAASGNLPGRRRGPAPGGKPPAVPIRFCSRWGLPCRFRCRSRGGLLPHRFTLTGASPGGLFSVALSLGSPPPDVIRHRVSVEPGLSSPAPFRVMRRRPSGRLTGA